MAGRTAGSTRTLRTVLLESGLIVFSILLALALSEWAEGRERAQLARQALRSFELEIRRNKQSIEEALPYHRTLLASVRRADSLGSVRSFADWREQIPEFSGFHAADLPATAWQSVISLGVLGELGYDTVAALSRLYYYQGKLDEYNWASAPFFDFSDASMAATVRRAYVYLATVAPNEELLLEIYEEVLGLIADGRAEGERGGDEP